MLELVPLGENLRDFSLGIRDPNWTGARLMDT